MNMHALLYSAFLLLIKYNMFAHILHFDIILLLRNIDIDNMYLTLYHIRYYIISYKWTYDIK